MKTRTADILEMIRSLILSDSFKERHKNSEQWFTRNKVFSFYITFALTLNLLRKTLQIEIYNFLEPHNLSLATKQAFCSARQKISPDAYIEINKTLVHEFYKNASLNLFLGFRLLLIDGSTLLLPDTPLTRKKFGTCSNGINKDLVPMARVSHVYDPLNNLTLDAIIAPYNTSERDMAIEHLNKIGTSNSGFRDLVIFDRGYPSITLMFFAKNNNQEVLIRTSLEFLPGHAQQKIKNGERDFIIELRAQKLKGKNRRRFERLMPNIHITSTIHVRVLVITLNNGIEEYLITTLTDSVEFPYDMFIELYNIRWDVEEDYKFIKIHAEIENFSTKTALGLEQEFYGTIFISNVRALIANEAKEEQEKIKPNRKYEYKINRNISLGLLKDKLVEVLFDKDEDINIFCERTKLLMKKNIIPVRKGRKFPRIRRVRRRHHMTIRRNL